MTQFMKLLLAGTITGMVMTTAAIGTAAAAGPENRITILYDAFGKDASMRTDTKLDFVVLSHRHGDHMAGLAHVLSVNPTVKIYAPKEGFGIYGSSLPSSFYRKAEACRRTCATSTANHPRS